MKKQIISVIGGKRRNIAVSLSTLLILIMAIGVLFDAWPAEAEDFVEISRADVGVDFLFNSPNKTIKVKITGDSHQEPVYVKLLTLAKENEICGFFECNGLQPVDDLYSLKFEPFKSDLFSQAPQATINYINDGRLKNIYYYDWTQMTWQKIDATRDTKKNTLTFNVPAVKELVFTLFDEPKLQGGASWYVHPRYPKELMAASTDFPFGTKVKVTNIANNKEVIVTIKDYGPDKAIHPDRVIDLGKEAFKKLAPTSAGLITVIVEPYQNTVSLAR